MTQNNILDKTRNPQLKKLQGLKIIFIFGSLEMGGSERQGLQLAQFLKNQHRADVQIWGLTKTHGRLSQLCNENGIPCRAIRFHRGSLWPIRFIKMFKFLRELKNEKADILLPYTWLPNVVCGLIWKLSQAEICIWNQRDEGRGLRGNLWERISVSRIPIFISNTDFGRNFLSETYNINKDKIAVINNGVTLPEPKYDRNSLRKNLGLDEECFIACMVANIHRYKDHPTLIKSWRIIIDQTKDHQLPPVLLLAGRSDEGGNELKALAHTLGIGNCVRFLGWVDDVAGLFNAVDLYVHSSTTEGLPNAVLEAMAAGLPVVATDIPGIRNAVGPEDYRFLAAPGNVEMFAEHVLEFIKDKSLRTQVGSLLKRRIKKYFDITSMCHKTVSFIVENLRNAK